MKLLYCIIILSVTSFLSQSFIFQHLVSNGISVELVSFQDFLFFAPNALLYAPFIEELLYRGFSSTWSRKKMILMILAYILNIYYKFFYLLNDIEGIYYNLLYFIASFLIPFVLLTIFAFSKNLLPSKFTIISLYIVSTLAFVFQHSDLYVRNEIIGLEGAFFVLLRFTGLFIIGSVFFFISRKFGLRLAIITHSFYNFLSLVITPFLVQIILG